MKSPSGHQFSKQRILNIETADARRVIFDIESNGMPGRLLVIDDTELHLAILARIAAQAGFSTTSASSFEEAVRLLGEINFDCITLDLSLGERSGVEVLHLLSEMNCRTPIIIISGSERSVCEETVRTGKYLNLKLCGLIAKPINLAVLRETLKQVATGIRIQQLVTSAR
jgi:CheY-like chemotaxis protein